MAHVRFSFRKADVVRALTAAQESGLDIAKLEIKPDGTLILSSGAEADSNTPTALDDWIKRHEEK